MLLPIETGTDNPILRKKSTPVEKITKKTLKLVKDMHETMIEANGVGIAAPQVGVNERIFLMTLDNKKVLPMINPEILEVSEKTEWGEEGCLSLPNQWGSVERSRAVMVRFKDLKGQTLTMKFEGFEAREIQHELDHLNGILFTDYLEDHQIAFEVREGEMV
ncbi:peptide deformylase [Candidatus Peregrinibacteria bacterium]|nr:peptide deformylase [Candidatus Peregrinibacteria bacterium]